MSVTYDFTDKVVLVTGGGSGIGLATATAFGRAGASVAIADISEAAAASAADAVRAAGGTAEPFTVDVADQDAVVGMVDDVVARFGRLDVAHNNAGIDPPGGPVAEIDPATWRKVVDVNLSSVFYCIRAEVPAMTAGGGGVIVNTSSAAGLIGAYGMSMYTAAKHGVIGLTKSAAMDYAKQGVRINAICPGPIDTPFLSDMPAETRTWLAGTTAIDRFGTADEVAQGVLWLSSDGASYVVGHSLSVDGGVVVGGDRHPGLPD